MLALLISVLIGLVVVWVVFYIIDMLPVPGPFDRVLKVVIALLALIWILQRAGWLAGVY